ncbi:TonB-dependent receptor plug domain-containing protein [Tenacibaculum sp. SG-28]|uniref:TonB-dependent receptor plug domain-containing protein n=1 Tax=Tenacibaculum sp. SG-28 TaxID=754426 RepID=UPI00267EC375
MKLKLKEFKSLAIVLFMTCSAYGQYTIIGTVTTEENIPINKVQIFDRDTGKVTNTSSDGSYSLASTRKEINVAFYSDGYKIKNITLNLTEGTNRLDVVLESFSEELSEIEISVQKRKVFELTRLRDVEQTAIYAGKKTEVILVGQATANLASNNARQIYNQVVGLNIFENDDAGLQLNIGGRGLDPNRTSNFNTRQNGYDISADVLGYPESYYSPPAEAMEEIQIVRGAASLQYGTQFGGLVNFVFKKPNPNKTFEFQTRNTLGSNNLFTNFTSVNGTKDKFSYFAFYNYKQGDGFRPNSEFSSKNAFAHFGYEFSSKSKLEAEITYLEYLAQQPGGLTDSMFNEDMFQSNRERNWFQVNWLLYNLKYFYEFSENTKMSLSFLV